MADERRGWLYGRKWKICIYKPAYTEETVQLENMTSTIKTRDPENDIAIDVSLLRCVFQTKQSTETAATVGTLVVYNMNAATEREVIEEGFQISIEAGYEWGQYGEVFTGDIVQVIRNREDGVDYKLEIIALKGGVMFDYNHTRCAIAAGSNPREAVEAIGKNSKLAISVGDISDNLSTQKLPRGKVLFGTPAKYLRDLTIGNNAYYWAGEDDKLTVKKAMDEIPDDECLVLSPGNPNLNEENMGGLIGTPQYTDNGINIKMLMDPRVKPLSYVKINNNIIRRQLLNINVNGQGNNQLPQQYQFDQDGEYQVYSVVHKGDTYGDDWYTEIVGISRMGKMSLNTDTVER